MVHRIFFQSSESCRDLTADEIGFILDVVWEHDKQMKIALEEGEAIWSIRLETQRYIDHMSNILGSSASFPLVTPKVTMLSLEDWTERPEPKSAFSSQLAFRRFLIMREYHTALRVPNTVFRDSTNGAFNNHLIKGASASEWLVRGYNSSSHTKSDRRSHRSNPPLPPETHLYRGR